MQTAHDVAPAHEIGRYHLVAELARGGMGIIHLAVSQGLGGFSKLLVVKELKPELAADEDYVAMFLDEARLAARLSHQNIVQTIEVGSENGRHYMVMELLDGRSLHRIGRRSASRGGMPVAAQLRVIAEALLGLHYAHELRGFDGLPLGIVHRDISPLNVFVTFDGQVKLIDFGIAKSVDSSLETKTGMLKGRVAYMAPEQAWGRNVDRRADVYAVGVMIWEAAAGRRLWPSMSDVEILARGLREGPPLLRSVQPDAAPELEAICKRALARDPDERHATAAELLDELETHLRHRPDAVSMREIGARVSEMFGEERRKMSALIDETLTRVRSGPRSGVMPAFDLHAMGTPSGSRAQLLEASRASERLLLSPSLDAPWTGAPLSAPPSSSGLSQAPEAMTPFAPAVAMPAPPPWWVSRRVTLAASAAVAMIVGVVALVATRGESEPAPRPALASAALGAPPPVREAVELVDVVVRVSPSSAQILIDGAPAPTNPFHGRYAKDGLVHHVMATAEGCDPKIEDVSFSGDVSIDVSLDRHASPQAARTIFITQAPPKASRHTGMSASSAPEPAASPVPSPPHPDVAPTGGHAPLRPIMTSDPYGSP